MELYNLLNTFKNNIINATTIDSLWDAFLKVIEPMVPTKVYTTGENIWPPPPKQNGVTLILSNHICDMDIVLINKFITKHRDKSIPVRLSGFTYEVFRWLPFLGHIVGRMLIGLKKKEDPEVLKDKIRWGLKQGYNTFVLFPEGSLFHKESYLSSIKWQKKQGYNSIMHEVLAPRTGAIDAFLDVVQDRLEYVVDITLQYPNFDPRAANWSYTSYPSAFYALFNNVPPPWIHSRVIKVNDWKELRDPRWLQRLWQKKNSRIKQRGKRQRERRINK